MAGDKKARIEQHMYVGLSSAELHEIAAEKVRFYERRKRFGEPFHHLLDAWQWVEQRHRGKGALLEKQTSKLILSAVTPQ